MGQGHSYEYDNAGNRTRAIVGYRIDRAVTIDSTYDALGRLSTLIEGTRTTTYSYDKSGNLRKKLLPNQITEEKTFDPLNRTLTIKHLRPGLADAMDQTAYTYNEQSSVAMVNETYPSVASGNAAPNRTITNTYDRTQRLLTETIAVIGGATTATTYTYDKSGNRASRSVSVNYASPSQDTSYHGYGADDFDHNGVVDTRSYAANQLRRTMRADGIKVAYLYDDFGNRTVRREYGVPGTSGSPPNMAAGNETRYFWDQNNKLVRVGKQGLSRPGAGGTGGEGTWVLSGTVTAWDFDYDHRGRQVIRNGPLTTDAEISFYSGGASVHQTKVTEASVSSWRSSPGSQTAAIANTLSFVRGSDMGGGVGGILYSLNQFNGLTTYQQHNSRGDVTAYTNSAGSFTFQSLYQSFGKHTDYGTAPGRERQRASSKDEEPVLGLLNEGFRYRDTDTGAFISRDPAGFVDGPNLYSYVRQNPWSTFDPDGLAERRKMSDDTYFVQNKSGRYQMVVPQLQNFGDRARGWGKEWKVADHAVSPLQIEDPSKLSAKQIAGMREALIEKFQADKELATAEHNYATSKALASLIPGASVGIAYADDGAVAAGKEAGKEAALTVLGVGIFKAGKGLAKLAKLENAAMKGGLLDDAARTWCFVAGTKVKTPDGDKTIERLIVGDRVITHDPETGEEKVQLVLQTFHSWTDELYDIKIGGDVLSTTGSHRFWLPDEKLWVAAKHLKAGHVLLGQKQARFRIDDISVRPNLCDVYNLEVESDHNYFVGLAGVLVHNGDVIPFDDFNQARNGALQWLEGRGFKAESQVMGKFGATQGRPIGMSTADGRVGFRVEFDARSGAHINVWDHNAPKGVRPPHFTFNASEKTVMNIHKQFFCK